MSRVKLLLFALPVLALWVLSVAGMSDQVASLAEGEAVSSASRAAQVLAQRLTERRAELTTIGLKLLGNAAFQNAAKNAGLFRAEAVTRDRFTTLRNAVMNLFPEPTEGSVVLGVWKEKGGGLFAQGRTDPVTSVPGLDMDALLQTGAEGQVLRLFGAPHLLITLSLQPASESAGASHVLLGLPVLPRGAVEEAQAALKLEALGVFSDGELVTGAGPEKTMLEQALNLSPSGGSVVLKRDWVSSVGPLRLPWVRGASMFSSRAAPRLVSTRQSLKPLAFDVVGIATVAPAMEGLAGEQRLFLYRLAGALALFLVVLVWIGLRPRGNGDEDETQALRAPTLKERDAAPFATAHKPYADSSDYTPAPAPVTAAAPLSSSPPPLGLPAEDPFASFGPAAPAAFPTAPLGTRPAVMEPQTYSFDGLPLGVPTGEEGTMGAPDHAMTAAYDAAPPPEAFREVAEDYNPEATRVVSVPSELLAESARPHAEPAMSEEERHFQEVFKDFLATRERCGEGADGLTYDKFLTKLTKNRDQLTQKYSCRTVRFQVYVKEGKAALKATPVRD